MAPLIATLSIPGPLQLAQKDSPCHCSFESRFRLPLSTPSMDYRMESCRIDGTSVKSIRKVHTRFMVVVCSLASPYSLPSRGHRAWVPEGGFTGFLRAITVTEQAIACSIYCECPKQCLKKMFRFLFRFFKPVFKSISTCLHCRSKFFMKLTTEYRDFRGRTYILHLLYDKLHQSV